MSTEKSTPKVHELSIGDVYRYKTTKTRYEVTAIQQAAAAIPAVVGDKEKNIEAVPAVPKKDFAIKVRSQKSGGEWWLKKKVELEKRVILLSNPKTVKMSLKLYQAVLDWSGHAGNGFKVNMKTASTTARHATITGDADVMASLKKGFEKFVKVREELAETLSGADKGANTKLLARGKKFIKDQL